MSKTWGLSAAAILNSRMSASQVMSLIFIFFQGLVGFYHQLYQGSGRWSILRQ